MFSLELMQISDGDVIQMLQSVIQHSVIAKYRSTESELVQIHVIFTKIVKLVIKQKFSKIFNLMGGAGL